MHDLNSNTPNFQLGDQVLIKIDKVPNGLSSKLYDKSDGPYRIVEVGPNFTYMLRRCSDNKLHGSMMNASNLKRYYDPEVTRPTFHTQGQGQDEIQVQQDEVDNNDTDTEQDEGLGQLFNDQNVAVNGHQTGIQNESTDSGQMSDEDSDTQDEAIYDPQKKWKFTKFLRGRFKNGRREIYVEWEDGSKTWEPDQCFDDEVLEMINRKFTKLGTVRKSCFKRNY